MIGRSRLTRLLHDRSATAAVEFAIILPVMLILYLGTFEASHAITTKRKVESAAEAVAGIVARSPEMDLTRLRNVLLVSDAIADGVSGAEPKITITTVRTDANGKATVDWQRIGTVAGAAKGTPYTLSGELAGLADAYFVVARVEYSYAPNFDVGGLFGTLEFDRSFTFRPRKGSEIPWK
ncbi:TadE/TadG family type IV pilus assembly protein [Aureimonas phyllosphaerae]|uniref:Flp pilus assembly protein TadG n=1 Tax=Aureimonas phyllosphaerae TaxID=1166078 RepID=A0A7W6FV62_9HYPH|nr:TadE/TadG family type IV pilus assembly protein [Aureimonas phyllosphaerae]MBB3935702.1 Flp pilus assembly protein TadG [Aureimonas phyllosphaerae]MBB3959710.1 Flp pilus assembly protein TadG [Aureimonas phyllosphaerae]SFF14065.1 Flp pilus assembly protein TadG [Aureimonas phyllosphaerae]